MNLMEPSDKIAHQRLRLSEFEFSVVYQAGIKHQGAEAILPLLTDGNHTIKLNNALLVLKIGPADEAKGAKCNVKI